MGAGVPPQVFRYIEPIGLDLTIWPDMYLIIDARTINDQMSKHLKGSHIGTNAIILKHLARTCRWFVLDTLNNLRGFMLRASADTEEPLLILCACDWGKHRSVGLVWFMNWRLKHLGHQTHVWHMCKERWSVSKSCGRNPCAGCDNNCALKLQLAAEVFGLWDGLFEPPPPFA